MVLSELGKECTKSCKVIGGFVGGSQEEEQVDTNRREVRRRMENVDEYLSDEVASDSEDEKESESQKTEP